LRDAALLVNVTGEPDLSDTATEVRVTWQDGTTTEAIHEIAHQSALPETERRLRQKATSLLGNTAAENIWSVVSSPNGNRARDVGRLLHGVES
jgi:hypothetical protein